MENSEAENETQEPLVQHTASMVELKAELARKQKQAEELRMKRDEGEDARKSRQKYSKKRDKEKAAVQVPNYSKSKKGGSSEDEELDAIASGSYKKKLEEKAKLYESLSKDRTTIGDELLAAASLVNFEQKNLDEIRRVDEEEYSDDEGTSSEHPGDGWVAYKDGLGRKKYCLEADLPFMKARSERRGESAKEKSEAWPDPREKEGFVHYQDVLQDEVRDHGVGYFAFSTDEADRLRQQEELNALRVSTKEARKKAASEAAKRKTALEKRLQKVRERKMLRKGLTIKSRLEKEEEEEQAAAEREKVEEKEESDEEDEVMGPQPPEAEEKPAVRPWDMGKIGVKLGLDYTEKCWMREQRDERLDEFAPPKSYDPKASGTQATWSRLRKPKTEDDSNREKKRSRKREKFGGLDYHDDGLETSVDSETPDEERKGIPGKTYASVPPPSTMDYFGPSTSKKAAHMPKPPDVAAALAFARAKWDKEHGGG